MDFWQTLLILVRRWYVTVPAFVASLSVAGLAFLSSPVQYESGSVLVLTAPLTGGMESTQAQAPAPITNPLLNFAPGLALTGSILIQELTSPETVSRLGVEPGGSTTYQVNNGTTNPELLQSGPFVFIAGNGASAEAAQDITVRVAARASAVLEERQVELGAPSSTHITLQTVVAPTIGRPLTGSPLRAAATSGALAALLSLVAVYGFESLMTHRRRRSGSPTAEELPVGSMAPVGTR